MKKIIAFLLIIIILLIILYIYARYIEPNFIKTNTINIHSMAISNSADGIKIVQFSDTHLSSYYNIEKLKKLVTKINLLEPDIIIFTGDLIDEYNTCSINTEDIINELSRLKAVYGKYSVYGNHDYGGGAQRIYKKIMKNSGFSLLINDSVVINKINLTITGLDEAIFGMPDTQNISNKALDNFYNILITHEPDIVDYIKNYNFDAALAGHSHGEQINIPFLDDIILPQYAQKYVRGIYKLNTPRDGFIYVNKGVGTTKMHLRFMAVPEISVFELNNTVE